MTDKQLTKF